MAFGVLGFLGYEAYLSVEELGRISNADIELFRKDLPDGSARPDADKFTALATTLSPDQVEFSGKVQPPTAALTDIAKEALRIGRKSG